MRVPVGEFGCEGYRLYQPANKLSCLLTQVVGEVPEGDPEEVTQALCERNRTLDRLCQVVRSSTGCTVRFVPGAITISNRRAFSLALPRTRRNRPRRVPLAELKNI